MCGNYEITEQLTLFPCVIYVIFHNYSLRYLCARQFLNDTTLRRPALSRGSAMCKASVSGAVCWHVNDVLRDT